MMMIGNEQPAQAVYKLRFALSAARAILAEDAAIAHPIPGWTISTSRLWETALAVGQGRASPRLKDALEAALDVMIVSDGELKVLARHIKSDVEWAIRCLHRHGTRPNNDDRIAAYYATDNAWALSAGAIRIVSVKSQQKSAANTAAQAGTSQQELV